MKYILGIDIGGTSVKTGIFTVDTRPRLVTSFSIPTRLEDSGVHILPDAVAEIEERLWQQRIHTEDVSGIGVGVPGAVLSVGGEDIVNRCVNLGWGRINVTKELHWLTGVHNIRVANDANAAALGEMYCGAGIHTNPANVVFVTIGTGVGAGIIVDRKLINGTNGAAGEIGHMKVAPFAFSKNEQGIRRPDSIEPLNDLEKYVSAVGIARVGEAMLQYYEGDSVLKAVMNVCGELTAKDIFDAAQQGDEAAHRITSFFFETLGTALANVATVADPDMFILGGGVSGAGEYLRYGLQRVYERQAFHAQEKTEFRIAELGNDAGIYGAACLVANI